MRVLGSRTLSAYYLVVYNREPDREQISAASKLCLILQCNLNNPGHLGSYSSLFRFPDYVVLCEAELLHGFTQVDDTSI